MKFTTNKTDFVNNILAPASKLADNLSLEFTGAGTVKTLVTSPDNSVIFIGEAECTGIEQHYKCVVPDCKTFLRLFTGIDENAISLNFDSNLISYKSKGVSFKYHLLDEGYMVEKKSISEEKIKQLEYDTRFAITKSKLSEITKFNSIIPDAEKLYLYTEGSAVFAKIGDDQKSNTNEIVTSCCESFTGDEICSSIPINIQNIHLMTFASEQIDVSINTKLKIIKMSSSCVQYIVSGLVK